jgi:hypothetical protein
MSEQQFEKCSLADATHVEMDGKLYELGKEYTSEQKVLKYNDFNIDVCRGTAGWQLTHIGSFPILGIKPLREKKQEPIEFETTFVKHDNHWHPLYSLDYGFPCQKYKTARFKCVQILEDEK